MGITMIRRTLFLLTLLVPIIYFATSLSSTKLPSNVEDRLTPRILFGAPSGLKAKILVGIVSVKRPQKDYLFHTLESLLRDKNATNGSHIFLLMLATFNDTWVDDVTTRLNKNYSHLIEAGVLQGIAPQIDIYPPFTLRSYNGNKEMDYFIYRAKQNMDFHYIFRYVYQEYKFKYYLHLEDDLMAANSYMSKMEEFIKSKGPDLFWSVINFCKLGFIGKLFKRTDVITLAYMFRGLYDSIPTDWVLSIYMMGKSLECASNKNDMYSKRQKACQERIFPTIKDSLFQHIGRQSSLLGKIQPLKDLTFKNNRK